MLESKNLHRLGLIAKNPDIPIRATNTAFAVLFELNEQPGIFVTQKNALMLELRKSDDSFIQVVITDSESVNVIVCHNHSHKEIYSADCDSKTIRDILKKSHNA